MTPETSIRIIIGVLCFIAGTVVALIAMMQEYKEKKPVKKIMRRGNENYPPVVNIVLDEFEESLSN